MTWHLFIIDVVTNVAFFGIAAIVAGRLVGETGGYLRRAVVGLTLGLTAVMCMLAPFTVTTGVIFDARSVAVAAAGLFGGPIAAAVAIIPPGIYRATLGGAGLTPGLISLALAAALGAGVRYWIDRDGGRVLLRHIAVASLLMPFTSIFAFPFFPTREMSLMVLEKMGPTLMLSLPPAMALVCVIFQSEARRRLDMVALTTRQSLIDAVHEDVPALLWRMRITADGAPEFLYVTESAQRLFDLRPDEIISHPERVIAAIHPNDRAGFLNALREGEATGRMPTHEFRTLSRQGEIRWLRSSAAPSDDEPERTWNGVTQDVTDYKIEETRNNVMGQVFEHLSVPVFWTDATFNVLYANPAALEAYGYSREEMVGAPASKFRPAERIESMRAFLDERVRSQTAGEILTDSLHKSGRLFPNLLQFNPLVALDGELTGWAVACIDQTERLAKERALEKLADSDALTGLSNRRYFDNQATTEVDRARRYGRALSVVLADIDHFKQVNDVHGHAVGDKALCQVARLMESAVRGGSDVVSRFGGEEFVLLLPETTPSEASELIERLRKAIEATPVIADGAPLHITCSFGVSAWRPTDASIREAVARADAALYLAKSDGRNRSRIAPDDLRNKPEPTGSGSKQAAFGRTGP